METGAWFLFVLITKDIWVCTLLGQMEDLIPLPRPSLQIPPHPPKKKAWEGQHGLHNEEPPAPICRQYSWGQSGCDWEQYKSWVSTPSLQAVFWDITRSVSEKHPLGWQENSSNCHGGLGACYHLARSPICLVFGFLVV